MKNPIYTLREIEVMPEFGRNSGWFYGLVKNHETGRVWIYEIFPGLGYASIWPIYHPQNWWWIIKDIWQATK